MTEVEVVAAPVAQPPGWYKDPDNPRQRRWWNGAEWGAPTKEDRQNALDARVAHWVKSDYRVESQSLEQAVLVRGHRPNHLLHLVLSIFTLGLWAIFVWIPLAIFGGEKRKAVSITPEGRPLESGTGLRDSFASV